MASPVSKPLPIRSAGGGDASIATSHASIASFYQGGPVLQHLRHVYSNLPQGQPFQELTALRDEESFLSYMSSPKSAALGPSPAASRDLSFPISSYYISSSHNTYLSGHQLYGEATAETYTNVLQRGCRCLEIDVWDGEDSDTSESGSEVDDDYPASTRSPKTKASRWSRMKAKAVQIRRSSPSKDRPSLAAAGNPRRGPDRLSPAASPELQMLKTEPRVLHGYTLTQSISFRAVCQAIAESAFVATSLPLIVSLEVHANLDQQQTMVEIMQESWKDHLVNLSEKDPSSLPSLESVRNKILIKVKWTPNSQTGESNDPTEQTTNTNTGACTEDVPGTPSSRQVKASKILHSLSQLGVYTRAYTFKQWDQPEASIPTHVFSLSEGKVHAMHADPAHGPALFNHNRIFLMRVFPKGTRIGSSNVDPTFHWRQGAQMVALNWQRLDKGMMLNEGMFTGLEGWVLKPEGYRAERGGSPLTTVKTGTKYPAPVKKNLDLKIQLLSGQDIPLPVEKDGSVRSASIKPYVKIYLDVDTHGPPGQGGGRQPTKTQGGAYPEDDKEEKEYKFRSKTQKSDSPNFDGDAAVWTGVPDVVEALSFVRFKVKDDRSMARDPLSSWACIRLDRLQTGLRFIHLLDAKGLPSRGILLARISKTLS